MDSAACIDSPHEFAVEVPAPAAYEVCASCPVRLLCRSWAIVHEEYGLWGGDTHNDREKLYVRGEKAKAKSQAYNLFWYKLKEYNEGEAN